MQHLKILVKGCVQGVGYRANTLKIAKQLAIKGTVKNHPDGHVEIQAAGKTQDMHNFVDWCHKGPLFAKVKTITLTPVLSPPLFTDFTIID